MLSPQKKPRRSTLEGAIEGLVIGVSSTSTSANMDIVKSIKGTFRKHWPQWGSLREKNKVARFTIKMDDYYRYYGFHEDLDERFTQASNDITSLQQSMNRLTSAQDIAFEKCLCEELILAIFGSNAIERVGADLDVTTRLCEQVFQGEEIEIEENSEPYEARLKGVVGQPSSGTSTEVRQEKEVIQHAKALRYISTALILNNEPLTEEILQQTHKILCEGIPLDDGGAQIEYAGIYRIDEVSAGFSAFSPPSSIPGEMARLIKEFNRDVEKAEKAGELDPFFLAAKYCHKFVNIHPFIDGNGRTCRLLLNTILLKYAGTVAPIGENDDDRSRYLDIAAAANMADEDEDEHPWAPLASLVLVRASDTLKKWSEQIV